MNVGSAAHSPGTHGALRLVCAVGVGLSLAVYTLSSTRRYLVNDDYQILHTAWLRAIGKTPGHDFAIYSYHLIIDLLTPLFRWFPETLVPLYAGRTAMVLTLAGVALLLYAVGGRLFGRTAGMIAPVLAISSQAMIHRGLDLRPDLLTTLIWLAMVWVMSSRRLLKAGPLLALGALAGVVFVNRFKAALIFPLVAIVLVQRAAQSIEGGWPNWRRGWAPMARAVALSLTGALVPLLLYAGWLGLHGELGTFLSVNLALVGVVEGASAVSRLQVARTLMTSMTQDPIVWCLGMFGIVERALRAREFSAQSNVLTGGLAIVMIASVVLNPAYYPYNLVTLVPLLALFAAYPVGAMVDRSADRRVLRVSAATLLVASPFLIGGRTLIDYATRRTDDHQLALERFLVDYTAPNAAVFALEGVGIFRPSLYHWRMPEVMRPVYEQGGMDFARELETTRPEIVIVSYRLPGWLLPRDREFIARHYVSLAPYVLAQGFGAGGPEARNEAFELLATTRYELLSGGTGQCLLDGRKVHSGELRTLARGRHTLHTPPNARCTVRRYYPDEARRMIANPDLLPYLVPPALSSIR
jgi:hypothetical protein